jgi:hypothetical protein
VNAGTIREEANVNVHDRGFISIRLLLPNLGRKLGEQAALMGGME